LPLSPRWRWKIDRWKEQWLGWLTPGDPEPQRPRICPSCGQLAGVGARRCPNCGASMTFSLAAATQTFSRFLPETSPATYSILFLCCLLYALSFLLTMRLGGAPSGGNSIFSFGAVSGQVLLALGARQAYYILSGQVWRLVTSIFLHANLVHIGMNMWVLMDIGPVVEEIYGSPRYLFLFLVTGILSMSISMIWNLMMGSVFGISIGASGALMGLIGLMLAVTTMRRGADMQVLRSQLIRWVFYIILLGVLVQGVDNVAHLGGLASGFLLGRVVKDRQPADHAERKRAHTMGWTAAVVIALSFVAVALQFVHIS
jgi:membrane associated rhomboid family serine protease